MADLVTRQPGHHLRSRHVDSLDFLSFVTKGELYAVDLASVQEIVVPPPITTVPRSGVAVLGVCSVRGQLVTVVDLRACLGYEPAAPSRKRRILLGRAQTEEIVGLQVDEVRQVVRLSPSELEFSSQTLGGEVSEAVRGIGRPHDGELLVLLDMAAMLEKGCF